MSFLRERFDFILPLFLSVYSVISCSKSGSSGDLMAWSIRFLPRSGSIIQPRHLSVVSSDMLKFMARLEPKKYSKTTHTLDTTAQMSG